MDAASSEWKSEKGVGFYHQPKSGLDLTSDELIAHWEALVDRYPIWSIEDGLDEEDWDGWKKMTRVLVSRASTRSEVERTASRISGCFRPCCLVYGTGAGQKTGHYPSGH